MLDNNIKATNNALWVKISKTSTMRILTNLVCNVKVRLVSRMYTVNLTFYKTNAIRDCFLQFFFLCKM